MIQTPNQKQQNLAAKNNRSRNSITLTINSNSRFDALIPPSELEKCINLPPLYKNGALAAYKIVLVNQCFYFDFSAPSGHSDESLDRTEHEVLHNEVLVNRYIKKPLKHIDHLKQGVKFVIELGETLQALQQGPFRVILSFSKGDCTTTFHKFRPEEVEYIDPRLENYKPEAVLTVDTED